MARRKQLRMYKDGIISLYREKERATDFSAKQNVETAEDMNFIVTLNFEECSKREKDLDFAEQHDFSLSLKVRTRLYPEIDNKCKAVVDGYLYDVSYIDKDKHEMWLYLEGIKQLRRDAIC